MRPEIKKMFGNWALITGASSGIGEGFAKQLAADGLNLVLAARRIEKIEDLGKRLSAEYNVRYRAIRADLSRPEGVAQLIEKTNDLEIGLLISNAGTGNVERFFERTIADLAERIQLNAVSHLLLTHHFGQRMVSRKRGGILLTGAMGAVEGVPYMAVEAATKGFIEALGKSLHHELKGSRVNLTVLVTTPTDTPVFYKLGFTLQNTPVKPISISQCVTEALNALAANKMLVYPGLKFRILRALTPERMGREMSAKILKKNNNIQ